MNEFYDMKGNRLSKNYESNYILDVPLVSTNLVECLDNLFVDENFDEENDNQYYNDKSESYIDAIKQHKILNPPKVFIISLKRWNNNLRKNQRKIQFCNSAFVI